VYVCVAVYCMFSHSFLSLPVSACVCLSVRCSLYHAYMCVCALFPVRACARACGMCVSWLRCVCTCVCVGVWVCLCMRVCVCVQLKYVGEPAVTQTRSGFVIPQLERGAFVRGTHTHAYTNTHTFAYSYITNLRGSVLPPIASPVACLATLRTHTYIHTLDHARGCTQF